MHKGNKNICGHAASGSSLSQSKSFVGFKFVLLYLSGLPAGNNPLEGANSMLNSCTWLFCVNSSQWVFLPLSTECPVVWISDSRSVNWLSSVTDGQYHAWIAIIDLTIQMNVVVCAVSTNQHHPGMIPVMSDPAFHVWAAFITCQSNNAAITDYRGRIIITSKQHFINCSGANLFWESVTRDQGPSSNRGRKPSAFVVAV